MTRDSAFRSPHRLERNHRAADDRTDPARDKRERLDRRSSARRASAVPPKDAAGPDPAPEVSAQDAAALLPEAQSAHHREAALFYDPPYESLLADHLARQLVRHLKPSCGLRHEQVALTPRNCFRLDFLIEVGEAEPGPERVGLLLGERPEAEGAPALYDALVVGSGAVDVLYRFDPEGLDAHLADALFLMSERDPSLFEQPERLHVHASQGPWSGVLQGPEVRLSYPEAPVEVEPGRLPERPEARPDLVMRRLVATEPSTWAEDYRRALTHFRVPECQHRDPAALHRRAKAA